LSRVGGWLGNSSNQKLIPEACEMASQKIAPFNAQVYQPRGSWAPQLWGGGLLRSFKYKMEKKRKKQGGKSGTFMLEFDANFLVQVEEERSIPLLENEEVASGLGK